MGHGSKFLNFSVSGTMWNFHMVPDTFFILLRLLIVRKMQYNGSKDVHGIVKNT